MAKSQRKTGMLLSYGGNLLLTAVNIFLTPFLVSSLGDAEYGVYQMMSSFAGYFVLMNFGTATVMTRNVSMYLGKGDKKGERNYIAMCLIITGVLFALIVGVSSVLYVFLDDIYGASLTAPQLEKAKVLFIIIAANVAITLISHAYRGIILAYEKFNFVGVWRILKTLLKVVFLYVLFLFCKDSIVIAAVDTGLSLLYMVICIIYTVKLKATPKLYKFEKKIFISSITFSLALMLQTIVNQVNSRVDVTILGIMISPESVTVYTVAMQIFSMFSVLSTAAVSVYLPKFTKLVASGEADGRRLTQEMIPPSRLQTLVSGGITFGFMVCGQDFIRMWMGPGYEKAYVIALILLIPNFLVYTNSVAEAVLDALQKRLVHSVVLCCVAVANIIMSIILVHFYGEYGAPIGTAIATVVGSLIIMNIYYKKVIGIKLKMLFTGIFRGILPCLLIATLATVPVCIFVPVSAVGLFVKGGTFVLVLIITLLLFGLNKEEKDLLINPIKKLIGRR